jgi:hypothetical protein
MVWEECLRAHQEQGRSTDNFWVTVSTAYFYEKWVCSSNTAPEVV